MATRLSGLSGVRCEWDKYQQKHPKLDVKCHIKDNGFNILRLWESTP